MPMPLTYLDRETFLSDYWAWKPGEHVALLLFEPTQQGKTLPT